MSRRYFTITQAVIWLGVGYWLAGMEWQRWEDLGDLNEWLASPNYNTTFPAVLWLLAPLFWWGGDLLERRGKRSPAITQTDHSPSDGESRAGWPVWLLAIVCAVASVGVSRGVSEIVVQPNPVLKFGDLPPAYHDEFSYRFQAETFLARRLSFPSHPEHPEMFNQMHVVNEGRFASRYFPTTGMWIAPFLAMGNPYWGHWLAGAITTWYVFWIGRELGGTSVGFLAGLLTAVSPALALFSNLLLAHHPTLATLTGFLFHFLRMVKTQRTGHAVIAGKALSLAMLSRPMSAAGFALPWGMFFVIWLLWSRKTEPAWTWGQRGRLFLGMGLPLFAGFAFLGWFSYEITGNPLTTPYQLYTDIYTPRHVYGFNNVERGEEKQGPKVIEEYDNWAENLTPELAWKNVRKRWIASWTWTCGLVLLWTVGLVYLLTLHRWSWQWHLVVAGILSLHLAHVPYWFSGIMDWHYVFETAPLWLLLAAGVSVFLIRQWRASGHSLMVWWWFGLIATTIAGNWLAEPVWPASRLERAVGEVSYSRIKYHRLEQQIETMVTEKPALVLIIPDRSEVHIDPINNHPSLEGEILRALYDPEKDSLQEIRNSFPDRTLYRANLTTNQFEKLPKD